MNKLKTIGAMVLVSGASLFASARPAEERAVSYLAHFGMNMWRDTRLEDAKPGEKRDPVENYRADEVRFDYAEWQRMSARLKEKGFNQIVIDLGEFPIYPSHPELAVRGSWPVAKLKGELKRLRGMGFELVPKLNFSAIHDTWMKEMHRRVSTPEYYALCRDLIRDVCAIFDHPRLFHLGFDEEDVNNGRWPEYFIYRRGELWWHDLKFLVGEVEKNGARAWIWADYAWGHRDEFIANCPKSVLLNTWYYWRFFDLNDEKMGAYYRNILETHIALDKAGFEQVPCASIWNCDENAAGLYAFSREHFTASRVKGFMMAPWLATLPKNAAKADRSMDLVAELADAPAGRNLVANASFAGDGVGGVLDWDVWKKSKSNCRVVRLPKAGPGGCDAVRLDFREQNYFFQGGFHLKPGARYRASVWVRTKGLAADAFRLAGWNKGWLAFWGTTTLPADTAGEWRKVEWRGEMIPSRDETYTLSVYGKISGDGCIEIASPCLAAEDPAIAAQSRGPSSSTPYVMRLVPIDKLLADIPNDDFTLTFYYPGDLDNAPADYEVAGTLDGKDVAAAALGADRRARLNFGKNVSATTHTIGVALRAKKGGAVVSKAEYPVRLYKPVKGTPGRKLNNFVTELLAKPLADGDYWFYRAQPGWVFIDFGAQLPRVTATLDNVGPAAVHYRRGERSETMRYLARGWHVLHVRGVDSEKCGSTLRICSVPRIVQAAPGCYGDRSSPYQLNYDFHERYLLNTYNTATIHHMQRHDCLMRDIFNPTLEERGIRLCASVNLAPWASERQDVQKSYDFLKKWPAWTWGFDLLLDETSLAGARRGRVCFTEALWRTIGEDAVQAVNVYNNDAVDEVWSDRATQTSEIASIINSGRGRGMLYPEVYPAALKDEKAAFAWEDHFLDYARTLSNFVPAAADCIVWYFGTFLVLGDWTDWSAPEADMRVQLDHFIRRIATDPAYAPYAAGGVAATHFNASDEDMGRYLAQAVRHYCIEGRTDDFAAAQGFKYLPGLVANADFATGLGDWKVRAAEEGSLKHAVEKNFGRDGQCRKKAPAGTGDGVALFTRTAKGANVLAQKLTGLTPGKVYSLVWCTADYDDWKGQKVTPAFGCRAILSGAEELPELAYERQSSRSAEGLNSHGTRATVCTTHRVVFRARAKEVKLGFSDWASNSEPGAPLGRRTMLNYVRLMPYFYADEAELTALRNMFRIPEHGQH